MTLVQLLTWGTEQLAEAGVPDHELDARYLLLEAFGLSLTDFFIKRGCQADEEKCSVYRELIGRRRMRIPLQQILGSQDFMGLTFTVNEHVLIPRQDTETLVELVLNQEKDKKISLLDLCTGSGCIAVSLAKLGGYERVWALDISPEALKVAQENAGRLLREYEGQWKLLQSDLFAALEGERFDVLTSNPPYIASAGIETLEPEVRDHEPRLALDGTEDGLEFYRRLSGEAGRHLKPGGRIYLEIGWDQRAAVEGLLRSAGFENIKVTRDLAGNDRVVSAGWPR